MPNNDLAVMPEVSVKRVSLASFDLSSKLRPIAKQKNNGITPLERANQLLGPADDVLRVAENASQQLYKVTIPEGCKLAQSASGSNAYRGVAQNVKGKFSGNVTLTKVSVSPAQIATLGLSAAAMVVGQAYMTEISDSLKDIDKKLDKVTSMIEDEQWSKVQNAIQAAARYAGNYQNGMMAEGSMSAQSAHNQLNSLYDSVSEVMIWVTKRLDSVAKELRAAETKEKSVQGVLDDLHQYEELFQLSEQALFTLAAAKMFYEDEITSERALHEENEIRYLAQGFIQKHAMIDAQLEVLIPAVKGFPLALPPKGDAALDDGAEKTDKPKKSNRVGRAISRLSSQTPREAARDRDREIRARMLAELRKNVTAAQDTIDAGGEVMDQLVKTVTSAKTLITDGETYWLLEEGTSEG